MPLRVFNSRKDDQNQFHTETCYDLHVSFGFFSKTDTLEAAKGSYERCDALKALGFKFDGISKSWHHPLPETEAEFAALIDKLVAEFGTVVSYDLDLLDLYRAGGGGQ